jgi:hypothetical protein
MLCTTLEKSCFFSVSNWPFGGVPVDPNRLFLLLLVKDFHVCPFYFSSSSFFLERVQFLFIFCSRGGGGWNGVDESGFISPSRDFPRLH